MKVALLASGPFAIPALELLDAGGEAFELCRVVCRPGRPAGRGRRLRENPVQARAQELGISCLSPPTVNTADFCDELRSSGLDAMIVSDYGEILREEILSLPPLGAFNIHASVLPSYRGAAPVVHAILKGEKETGVTLFRIERGLDSGPVVACAGAEIGAGETAGELEERLAVLGAGLLAEQLPLIAAGEAAGEPQDESRVSLAPKVSKADGLIEWNNPASAVHDQVRAMNPWPLAHSFLSPARGKPARVSILRSAPAEEDDGAESRPPGTVCRVEGDGFSVSCSSGALRVLELQRDGKSAMDAAAYLRGSPLEPGDLFNSSPPETR